MARYTDSVCRLCRREGAKLFLKGDRCYGGKCAFERRPVAPGQHGLSRKKLSEYGIQLREKQKAKRSYGILESQFRKYYEMATRMSGVTGENLMQLLETRLDNCIYRLGFGVSRAQARQLVTHGHFLVNGKKVDIPSYMVKPGDVITVKDSSKKMEHFTLLKEAHKTTPSWLELNADKLEGKIIAVPKREDMDVTIAEHLIVELYSK